MARLLMGPRPKKLLDQLRDAIRLKHYAYRTEETYAQWVRRYILFHDKQHPNQKGNILELLGNWRINVAVSENLREEDRELLMNLSSAYLRWREETLQQGRQEGRREGRLEEQQQMVKNLLKVRFGTLDEELSRAIAPMLQLPTEELTRLLLTFIP